MNWCDQCQLKRTKKMNVETRRVSGRTEATSSSLRIPDCPQVSRSSSAWDQKFSSCSASVLSGGPVKLLFKSTVLVKNLPDTYVYIHLYTCVCVQSLRHIQLFAILWTVACQDPLSMGFSRQEYWSGLPISFPGDLSNPRN